MIGEHGPQVWPEDRAGRQEFTGVEEGGRIPYRRIVGVDQQDAGEGRPQQGIGLERPAAELAVGMRRELREGIDELDCERAQPVDPGGIELFLPQVPDLDGEPAAQSAQAVDADPGIGEVALPARGYDDAVSREMTGNIGASRSLRRRREGRAGFDR